MGIAHEAKQQVKVNGNDWIERFARFGYVAKGVVYVLIGILAALAAFNLGGEVTDRKGVLEFIAAKPFGQVLLTLMALGLLGYVIWRFIQAAKLPRESDKGDAKAIGKRIAYVFSGLAYLAFAIYAIKMVVDEAGSSGGGGGNSRQGIVAKALGWGIGPYLIGAAALGFIGWGIFELYRAYTTKFDKHLKKGEMNSGEEKTYTLLGRLGYAARGIVFGILGYFFMRAALQHDPQEAQGTESAFHFLQNTGGAILMGAVALGVLAYGLFMFVRARYEKIDVRG